MNFRCLLDALLCVKVVGVFVRFSFFNHPILVCYPKVSPVNSTKTYLKQDLFMAKVLVGCQLLTTTYIKSFNASRTKVAGNVIIIVIDSVQ
jgi:hypothetical protein